MAGGFPQLTGGDEISGPVNPPTMRDTTPTGLGELSNHLDQVGAQLHGLAMQAADTEGKAAGSADAAAGEVSPRDPNTAFGQAYNAVAKQSLGEQRRASIIADVGKAIAANPNNPAELTKSLAAIKAGYGDTPYADLNAQLNNEFDLHAANAQAQAAEGLHRTMVEIQAGNFAQAETRAGGTLGQIAAGASFDTAGATRVAGAVTNYADSLAQYGPREAFAIGDVKYPADPARAGIISPAEINARAIAATAEAKRSWMISAQKGLPDSAAQAKFADDLRTRYEKGDAIFAGLDGPHAESLFNALDTQAAKSGQDERIDQASHAQNAERLIEAVQWGAPADPDALRTQAAASKDPGLIAKAEFYATAGSQIRGVLKTVVARQLGLIPSPGQGGLGVQLLDANGQPLTGSLADRNNNPGNLRPLPQGQWNGQVGVSGGFAQFSTPDAGRAAAEKNLIAKQTVHGLSTLSAIIGAPGVGWAPAGDGANSPAAYAAAVSRAVGVDPNAPIDIVHNADLRQRVLNAIFAQEGARQSGPTAAPSPGAAWTPPPSATPGTPAFAAWANTKAGFTADPIKYAAENNVANVPPMIPQAAWSQDSGQLAGWTAAIKARAAVGQGLQSSYGVPSRMLTDAERDDYKSFLAANPAAVVPLAARATAALGGDGAARLLREIGADGDVNTPIHIGQLAAQGNSVIANAAADGITLKAAGAKENIDPIWRAKYRDTVASLQPAFRYAPAVLVAAQNTAELARLSDQAKGLAHDPAYYLQAALGAAPSPDGHTYGGVTAVNGAPTLLPPWLRQDRAADALRAIGDAWAAHPGAGPVYANGQPMSGRDVARLRLVAQPDGHYLLTDPRSGMLARLPGGGGALLNFDAERGYIAGRLPGAVRR